MVMLSTMVYGDMTKYGVRRPNEGPFYMKVKHGKYPVIDVGTYKKIKTQELKVPYSLWLVKHISLMFKPPLKLKIAKYLHACFRNFFLSYFKIPYININKYYNLVKYNYILKR